MINKSEYPILEYDDAKTAKLNPQSFDPGRFDTDKMVITFFPEVIKRLLEEDKLTPDRIVPGENPVEIYAFKDDPDVLITLGQVGCPACAGNLDLFHEMGVCKVMFCGGGGDDLSGEEWSERGWRSREGIRYDLVNLCKKLVYKI